MACGDSAGSPCSSIAYHLVILHCRRVPPGSKISYSEVSDQEKVEMGSTAIETWFEHVPIAFSQLTCTAETELCGQQCLRWTMTPFVIVKVQTFAPEESRNLYVDGEKVRNNRNVCFTLRSNWVTRKYLVRFLLSVIAFQSRMSHFDHAG